MFSVKPAANGADFVAARIAELDDDQNTWQTTAGVMLGTPGYMSPEQAQGLPTVGTSTDIYALGVVFYQMLTGELPLGKFPAPSQKVQVDVRLEPEALPDRLALEPAPWIVARECNRTLRMGGGLRKLLGLGG